MWIILAFLIGFIAVGALMMWKAQWLADTNRNVLIFMVSVRITSRFRLRVAKNMSPPGWPLVPLPTYWFMMVGGMMVGFGLLLLLIWFGSVRDPVVLAP